jgi:iron-sulfur cluster assembly accessory protein
MTVSTFEAHPEPLIQSINITDDALAHFTQLLTKQGHQGIRISLKEAGCTGFKYVIEEVMGPSMGDTQRKISDHVSLYVETGCLLALKDLVIDIQKVGLNTQLVMNNPNIKDACGCGESFRV